MKKIYSKILLTSLLILISFKNLFIKKAIATSIDDGVLLGDVVATPLNPIEKIINGTKIIILSPILAIGIIFVLIFIFLKIKKINIKNINLFLISGILAIILYFISSITVMTFQERIDNLLYEDWNIFLLILNNKYILILVLSNIILFFSFLYFLIKTIIVNLKTRKNLMVNKK